MQQVMDIKKISMNNEKIVSDQENIFDKETINSLLKSEQDIEKGRTRKAIEVIKEFEEKYEF